jgi:hypothetical protein
MTSGVATSTSCDPSLDAQTSALQKSTPLSEVSSTSVSGQVAPSTAICCFTSSFVGAMKMMCLACRPAIRSATSEFAKRFTSRLAMRVLPEPVGSSATTLRSQACLKSAS